MPVIDGIEVLKYLKRKNIPHKTILLSSYDDVQIVKKVLQLGALGYLSKSSASQHLLKAIKIYEYMKSKNIDVIIDDTEENFSSKIKKFNLLGVPYQIMIGKKSENDVIEYKEIGSDSKYLKIDKIIELISNKKK